MEQTTLELAIDVTYALAMCGALALALRSVATAAFRWAKADGDGRRVHVTELLWSAIPLAFLIVLFALLAPVTHG